MSDADLEEAFCEAIVECLTALDESATADWAVAAERYWRERRRRHVKANGVGCVCSECMKRYEQLL
jgi:hypothetical protein